MDESLTALASGPMPAAHNLRGVLEVRPFRRLWLALSLSSLGDWLGLLATTALAYDLEGGASAGSFAVGGVFFFRLLPALLLGPFAGAFADRFDRRVQMVTCDVGRCLLFVSIPLVGTLWYLLAASFVIEAISLFWIPAKEASVPNLLPRHRLEAANQLSLVTTYGSAPVASLVFVLISKFSDALGSGISFFDTNPTDLALFFNALTFLFSAATVVRIREISGHRGQGDASESLGETSVFRAIAEGVQFVKGTPFLRGLLVGMLGAFAAGGAVVALAKPFAALFNGGNAGYGALFGAIFTGLALGMFVGPRLLRDFSRFRLFGLSIVLGGVSLSVLALLPNLVVAVLATVVVGGFAGVAWVIGYTLIGGEVEDAVRGRTFALVQSLVRVDLLLVIASAPIIAGAIGDHHAEIGVVNVRLDGVTMTLFGAGLLGVAVGVLSYRQMDDRDVPLWRDLVASFRGLPLASPREGGGLFVVFEGGEGAGKSTQVSLLSEWLRSAGVTVVVTREPGATQLGTRIRALLLDPASRMAPRAEALLYAADRADHVDTVIAPALDRGEVVISDRYVDSSLAYQGAGRALAVDDVAKISRWATDGLTPDLTVLLDVPPDTGLDRAGNAPDRLEAEPVDFHQRVRHGFRDLAEREPGRYLVLDASLPVEEIAVRVRNRVSRMLPFLAEAASAGAEAAAPAAALPIGGES